MAVNEEIAGRPNRSVNREVLSHRLQAVVYFVDAVDR